MRLFHTKRSMQLNFLISSFQTEFVSWGPRGRESSEPLWLKGYKKRQKERRESQEKREALAMKQAIEGSAYGRPIAPKFNGTACAVALPSATSNNEQVAVTWVAIATRTSPWKAVSSPQPVEVAREMENIQITAHHPTTTPPADRYLHNLFIEKIKYGYRNCCRYRICFEESRIWHLCR